MKRVLDHDPVTGMTTWYEYDAHTDTVTLQEVQDAEPALIANKAIRNHGGGKGRLNEYSREGIKANWWHVATIPNGVIMQWKREKGVDVFNKDHSAAVTKLLNDPDWKYLRTGTGKV